MDQSKNEWKWMMARLSGNISPQQDELLNAWLNQSKEHQALFEEAEKIWASSGDPLQLETPSTDSEWKKLEQQLQQQETKTRYLRPRIWMGVAASLVLSLGGIYYFYSEKPQPTISQAHPIDSTVASTPAQHTPTAESVTTITSGAKVLTLQLPDGSRLWLNQNSTLTYSENFAADRQLNLEGEAYFMVQHDARHPFRVNTRSAQVIVLGTSFNVKEKDNSVVVNVATGKVKVVAEKSMSEITLQVNEKGIVKNGKALLAKADPSYASWREKNNTRYDQEKRNPESFISNSYSWKKNQINRSVIEGKITNTASLATYHGIVLKATYIKRNKKTVRVRIPINGVLQPGESIVYRKKLLDILTQTQSSKVEIEQVEVLSNIASDYE